VCDYLPKDYFGSILQMILLSILICTIPQRKEFLRRLYKILYTQLIDSPYKEFVEIIVAEDECIMSVGEKRNRLIEAAKGRYIVFIDDDDTIPPYYIERLIPILDYGEFDCIGFKFVFRFNGRNNPSPGIASLRCNEWICNIDKMTRPISHINPIRKSIASSIKFPLQNRGEDSLWSEELKKHLSNEYFIDDFMYYYEACPAFSTSSIENYEIYMGIVLVEFNLELIRDLNLIHI